MRPSLVFICVFTGWAITAAPASAGAVSADGGDSAMVPVVPGRLPVTTLWSYLGLTYARLTPEQRLQLTGQSEDLDGSTRPVAEPLPTELDRDLKRSVPDGRQRAAVQEWLQRMEPSRYLSRDPDWLKTILQSQGISAPEVPTSMAELPVEQFHEQTWRSGVAAGPTLKILGLPPVGVGLSLGMGVTVLDWSRHSTHVLAPEDRHLCFSFGVARRKYVAWVSVGGGWLSRGVFGTNWSETVLSRDLQIGYGNAPVESGTWELHTSRKAVAEEMDSFRRHAAEAWTGGFHPQIIALQAPAG